MKSSLYTRRSALVFAAVLGMSCAPTGRGVDPPPGAIYFPVGLLVDSDSGHLYVVGSDFDLQFNQGTIQSLSLERIRALARDPCASDANCSAGQHCDVLPTTENRSEPSFVCVDSRGPRAGMPCGMLDESTAGVRSVSPGRCAAVSLLEPEDGGRGLVEDAVGVSAFATGALMVSPPGGEPGAPSRMFVPVRGDSTLQWLDVADGKFACGQESDAAEFSLPRCSPDHQVSLAPDWIQEQQPHPNADQPDLTTPSLLVAPEPYELAATADGRVLVMTHQLGGTVSAFVNDWVGSPQLVARQIGLSSSLIGVAAMPPPALAAGGPPDEGAGFLVTTRSEARIYLLRFLGDGIFGSEPRTQPIAVDESARPALLQVASGGITLNARGSDSRAVAVDPLRRQSAEAACAPGDTECLAAAAALPLDVYVANRSPNSLLVGTTTAREGDSATDALPTFHDNIPLTSGPSRVALGHVMTPSGELERRVFITCFDSALIYVYDPVRRLVESEIATGRGPQSIAFDGKEPLLYVGHFTDSYLGVVSLDQRYPKTYGAMLALVGHPTPPRASK